jgi:hypothetical protein
MAKAASGNFDHLVHQELVIGEGPVIANTFPHTSSTA